MHIHFSYGSNMDVEAMRLRCPQGRALGMARLSGWSYFIAASGYASLRRKAGATACGVLWRLEDDDLAALDLYEDLAGGLYRKTWLPVDRGGRRWRAMVYLALDGRLGCPQPQYQDGVIVAARRWRFPARALRNLEAWRTGQA